jgi:hypothetical protein
MPKIPTFTSEARLTAEPAGVAANIKVPMIDIAGDLQKTIAKYYIEEKKEEAKVKSLEYENDSWSGLYDILDKNKNNPYPSDAINNFNNDVQAYKQNYLNTKLANESKLTKDAWLQKFDANVGSATLSLNKITRDNLEKKKDVEDDRFSSTMSTRLRLDDIYSNKVDLDIENYVNSKYSDPNVQNLKKQGLTKIKEATIVDKRARQEPLKFLSDLSQNPELYNNAPEAKERAIIYAQNLIEQNQDNMFNQSIASTISQIPYGQQADFISSVEPQIKQLFPDAKTQNKAMNLAQNLFNNKLKTIKEKGAAEYFINNDATINQEYQLALSGPIEFKTYVEKINKKYDQQKIPNESRTYLPSNKIQEINDSIQGRTDPKEKIQVINALKNLYGDSMPSVNKQIDKQIGTGIALAISTNDPDLQYFSILGDLSDDDKKIVKSKVDDTNVEDALLKKIRENLSPLSNIVANQPEGFTTYGKNIESTILKIKNAAMRGILENKYENTSAAADKLTQGFLNDYITVNETFYIPYDVNGKIVSSDLIEAKAHIFANKLYFNAIDLTDFNVDPIGSGGVFKSQQETIDRFKRDGEWYMDGNTGIKFGIKEPFGGFTPMSINGKNVRINFLDYDGEFKTMTDKNGNNFVLSMTDIYNFINSEYLGQQVP